jgi:CspA family cold shock protein
MKAGLMRQRRLRGTKLCNLPHGSSLGAHPIGFMPTGTVKFYNDQKGYGFIAPDGGGNDVFVHATALERAGISSLREGQKVSFETEVDRRSGKTAVSTIRPA